MTITQMIERLPRRLLTMSGFVTRRQVLSLASIGLVSAGMAAAFVPGTPATSLRRLTTGTTPAPTDREMSVGRDLARTGSDGRDLTELYWAMQSTPLSPTGVGRKVIVVGAGAAGLSLASMLTRSGFEVQVLEASDRVGGRLLTQRQGWADPASRAELGGMRIPDSHTLATGMTQTLGLDLRPFTAVQDDRVISAYGHTTTVGRYAADHRPLNSAFGLSADRSADDILADALRPMSDLVEGDTAEEWAQLLSVYDRLSLREVLDKAPLTQGQQDLVGTLNTLNGRMELGALHSYLSSTMIGSSRLWEITSGMDQLPRRLADRVPTQAIEFGAKVTAVDTRPALVRVTTEDGTVWEADQVVLAVPLSCLRTVEFTPALSDGKQQAIGEIHYDAAVKVLLEFENRWWPGDGGIDVTDTALRRTVYPSHPEGDGGVVTAAYCWGQDALVWDAMDPEVRAKEALEMMARLHGQAVRREYTGRWATMAWGRNDLATGEAAVYAPGQAVELGPDTRTPEADGRLWLAGDGTSTRYRAWIEGALESACRVARELGVQPLTEGAPQ